MRKLPVYFLMDLSDSMIGEPISGVQKGMASMINELRSDPYALETVFVSALGFAGKAVELAPLTDVSLFEAPDLPIGSGTNLGDGLNLLMRSIDREVQKTTTNKKGDWKPIVFLFTDGAPTDDPGAEIRKWRDKYRSNASMIAVTFGKNADVTMLQQLTDDVLTLTDLSSESFMEFFRWVSASMKASSVAVCEHGRDSAYLSPHCINLEKAVLSDKIDENYALLPMKCSKHGDFWLAKYEKCGQSKWNLVGAWQVDEAKYNSLGGGGKAGSIELGDTDKLPVCPSCGDDTGVVKCACGNLSCWPDKPSLCCPWCGNPFGELRTVNSVNAGRSRG